jgi:UDP-glucuronate 4-epimerase
MKILITGAAGFIGYHLVNRLAQHHEIAGIDNLNNYYDVNLKLDRLRQAGIPADNLRENRLWQSSNYATYHFAKIDLANQKELFSLFKGNTFDVVINLAAQAGVRYSIDNPDAYLQSNMVGFHNIVEACRQFGVPYLIYASSSSVYGNSTIVPFSESQQVDNPISLYAATKKSNELVAHVYNHLYGIKMAGLRFFTVYGEWGRPDMAYFKFVDKILNRQPIEVYNNGNLERDFTYVDDIIDGIEKMVINPASAPYKIYNIGNSKPVNLLQFIETIEEALGLKAKKIMKPMQPGDVYRTWADTSQLENDFGYKPDTPLSQGIYRFVEWYKTYYNL